MITYAIILIFIIFLFTLFFLKIYKNISNKLKFIDIPDSLSVHKSITPTGAGIIFFVILLFFCEYLINTQIIKINLPKNYYFFLSSLTFLTLVSFYDDLKKIHPVIRLFFQITIVFFSTSLFNIETIGIPVKLAILLIIYFWVYTINITNFTDGVDGFLTVNALNFFLCVFLFYYLNNQENFVYLICLICIPILLGYLIFNKPPASLFMGDAGSIFIGFLIGYISIQLIIINRVDIVISLLSYTYMDCTITIIKKTIKRQAPWARLFDYYFLIPIKNKQSHKKVFSINLIYNLCIFAIVACQIIFDIQFLCILSLFLSLMLIYYFKSFSKN
jgi:UDP-N-acetylmuramyl pentapeptide phosphotransferase/UDP-N-acetylglucosamine-1-phosphate transferase